MKLLTENRDVLRIKNRVIEALSKLAREGVYESASSKIILGLDKIFRRILANNLSGKIILDIGCGSGVMYKYSHQYLRLLDKRFKLTPLYIFLDLSNDFLELVHIIYRGDPYVDIVQGYAEYLPFRKKSVDTVISAFMLRDVYDLAKTITNMLYTANNKILILDFYKPPNILVYIAELMYIYLVVPIIILLSHPYLIREYLYLGLTVITQNNLRNLVRIFSRFRGYDLCLNCWFGCSIFLLKIQRQ